jgi:hypothetical protein
MDEMSYYDGGIKSHLIAPDYFLHRPPDLRTCMAKSGALGGFSVAHAQTQNSSRGGATLEAQAGAPHDMSPERSAISHEHYY